MTVVATEASCGRPSVAARLALAGGAVSILIGWASLTGWGFDVGWLRNPFPGSVTMQRNSAASLVLCGASLVLYAIRGRAARVPRWVKIVRCVGTGAVVLVAGLASAQHLTGTNFGIDQLLGRGSVDFTHFPAGRMGPTTAAGLLLVSLSLLVPRRERGLMEQAAQYLALGALMIASHGLIVYAYRAAGVYETPAYRPMSAYTALGLAALSAGALMARAHAMPVAFLAGRSPTALLTRRLLLGAVVAPPALGLCIGLIARDGGYEHGYGLALLAWVSMVMLSALIWSTSARFQSSDAARRQAEDRVRRSEERLRFALEAAQMVAWEWDPNSDCVVRTGGLDLLLGENAPTPRGPAAAPGRSLDPEAFGAQRFFEMIHPLDRDSVLKAIRASLDDGSEYHVEFRLKRPDGAARWVADHGRVTRDASGRPIRMNGVMLDVTERKLTDQALYRSQKFLHATLNSLTEQVAILDGAGAIVHVNDAWRRFTQDNGLGAAATEGRCGLELCRRLTGGDIAGAGLRRVLSGESFDFRHEYALSTGSVGEAGSSPARWFQISVNRFAGAESGVDSTRLVVTNHDMTETKRAEQERARILERERRLRTEAEAANAAKDQFLAVLSHELRTPLTPVLSTVETMLCDHPAPGADRDALQMVRRNVELEARLIDDLLDLTRIARGKLEISAHAVDVHALIHSTVGICRGDMELKGQDLVLDLNARPHHVRADPARLQQVLWNLLKNAVKFTPEGGHVVIATEEIDGGHTVRISIKDDGMGIEPDVLPRIFEAFEQGERSVTRRFGGLGLGLAISKALVDLHGGRLTAQSEGTGRGSMFTLDLPALVVTDLVVNVPAPSAWPPGGHRPTILLVDDHPDTTFALSRALRYSGYDVATASSVAGAMKLASEREFDVLVSDIGLPDGSGLDLMRQFQALGKSPRGIAVSGFGMDEDVQRSKEAGFLEHLVKPINLAQLEAALRAVTMDLETAGTDAPHQSRV